MRSRPAAIFRAWPFINEVCALQEETINPPKTIEQMTPKTGAGQLSCTEKFWIQQTVKIIGIDGFKEQLTFQYSVPARSALLIRCITPYNSMLYRVMELTVIISSVLITWLKINRMFVLSNCRMDSLGFNKRGQPHMATILLP